MAEALGSAYLRGATVSAEAGSGNSGEEMLVEAPGMLCGIKCLLGEYWIKSYMLRAPELLTISINFLESS